MKPSRRQRPSRPLNEERLNELALRYVGRFATSRSKLRAYLARKLRECGWDGAREPDPAGIAERFATLGYVDDSSYALAKSQSLTSRGYGKRRVIDALKVAGIDEEHSPGALDHADSEAVEAGLRFARRRRIGPYASEKSDPQMMQKALAAMIRAGHPFALSRAILALEPGEEFDPDQLKV